MRDEGKHDLDIMEGNFSNSVSNLLEFLEENNRGIIYRGSSEYIPSLNQLIEDRRRDVI